MNVYWRRRIGTVLVAVVGSAATVAFLGLVLKVAPEWLAQDGLRGKYRAEDVARGRTAVLAVVAGLIAITGAVFTGLSYRLNQHGQLTERFTRAIDQLGSESIDVRLGGIYALERIAKDSRPDHPQVIEVLSAFVRERSPWPPEPRKAKLPTDIQAVVDVLARRKTAHDRPGATLDLASTDLRSVRLIDGHFENVSLSSAHLENAYALDAHLEGAVLMDAHLQGAYLVGSKLRGAYLTNARLQGTDLTGVNLDEANLHGATWDKWTRWPEGVDPVERTGRPASD